MLGIDLVIPTLMVDGTSAGLMTRGRTRLFDIRGREGKANGVDGEGSRDRRLDRKKLAERVGFEPTNTR